MTVRALKWALPHSILALTRRAVGLCAQQLQVGASRMAEAAGFWIRRRALIERGKRVERKRRRGQVELGALLEVTLKNVDHAFRAGVDD